MSTRNRASRGRGPLDNPSNALVSYTVAKKRVSAPTSQPPSLYRALCPAYKRPWLGISLQYKVKPSGEGSKLLELTDCLFTPPTTVEEAKKGRINLIHENPAMSKIPMFVKTGKKERGMSGTGCENPDCSFIEGIQVPEKAQDTDGVVPKQDRTVVKRCGRVS